MPHKRKRLKTEKKYDKITIQTALQIIQETKKTFFLFREEQNKQITLEEEIKTESDDYNNLITENESLLNIEDKDIQCNNFDVETSLDDYLILMKNGLNNKINKLKKS